MVEKTVPQKDDDTAPTRLIDHVEVEVEVGPPSELGKP